MAQLSNPLRLVALAIALACTCMSAQVTPPAKPAPPQEQAKADAHKLPAERGDIVDRIAAIVNGDIVLESDVEDEERFTRLNPYGEDTEGKSPHDAALTRMIDRTLILQQERGYPQVPVTDESVDKDEADMRKDLPACAKADCASDAGWKNFLATYGFTREELRERLRQRTGILHFIETRFRSGIRVTDHQISDYYNNTMLPEYAKRGATAPPLDTVEDRIEDVLLEQQVSVLLDQWLKTLRDSGHVRILKSGEEAP